MRPAHNLSTYKKAIESAFPQIAVHAMQYLGGESNSVFEVNNRIIFRFPNSPEVARSIDLEARVYPALGPLLPVPTPSYRYRSAGTDSFPLPFSGYPKLPGLPLRSVAASKSPDPFLANDLAAFLTALHVVPTSTSLELGIELDDPETSRRNIRDTWDRVQSLVHPLLSRAQIAWTQALFASILSNPAFLEFEPTLVHGDFDPTNVLVDPHTFALLGVVDFEDVSVGDPAGEFCTFLGEYGTPFFEKMLSSYSLPVDAHFADRARFRWSASPFNYLLFGVEHSSDWHLQAGMEKLQRRMNE